ncbi:nucleolar protein 12 [Scleropages formosus]|uniref:Nucleolar protein 12 n=1 Tax=Scleropages formosus TaxID=113540 RepID=A0A8C9TCJ6_SCLFO|nr:nucleolar protein 12 [Scleropages formosus]
MAKKGKSKPGGKRRENKCIVTFNESSRNEFLTGFHKRKMERRKAAVEEIKNKLKEEQKKVREERHKEYMKMLKERKEALEEADELEDAITSTTESLQYDYPNHTVTVTTINDLDLTGASRLEPVDTQATDDSEDEKNEEVSTVPKKAGEPIISKKLSALTASLHARTKQWKKKGTKWEKGQGRTGRGRAPDGKSGATERKSRLGRTSKRQRRRQTGKKIHQQE